MPVENALDFSPSITGWNENSGNPPYIGINNTAAEVDSEGIELPTGVLAMHPGPNGEYPDLRFTVAQAGASASPISTGIDTAATGAQHAD